MLWFRNKSSSTINQSRVSKNNFSTLRELRKIIIIIFNYKTQFRSSKLMLIIKAPSVLKPRQDNSRVHPNQQHGEDLQLTWFLCVGLLLSLELHTNHVIWKSMKWTLRLLLLFLFEILMLQLEHICKVCLSTCLNYAA